MIDQLLGVLVKLVAYHQVQVLVRHFGIIKGVSRFPAEGEACRLGDWVPDFQSAADVVGQEPDLARVRLEERERVRGFRNLKP